MSLEIEQAFTSSFTCRNASESDFHVLRRHLDCLFGFEGFEGATPTLTPDPPAAAGPRPPGFLPGDARKLPPAIRAARKHFYDMGWSCRSAAPVLGVCFQHLCQVLTGDRSSKRLLAAIHELPRRVK